MREHLIKRDERVRLELSQGDVLGIESVQPSELLGNAPGSALQDAVSEKSNPQSARVGEVPLGVPSGHLLAPHRPVETGQHQRAKQRRSENLVRVRDPYPLARHANRNIWTDHEPGHRRPRQDLVALDVFIPTAERSNLICEIDRSFIGSPAPGAREPVELMINAAHAFGLRVVAEGAEHGEQLTPPIDIGCDFAQGYYLARPQPAAAFAPTAPTAPTTSAGLSDLGR